MPPTAGVTATSWLAPAAVVGARSKLAGVPPPATVNGNVVAGSVNGAAFFTTFNDAALGLFS